MISKLSKYSFKSALSVLVISLFFMSCEALKTAPYDQYSYQKTIDIKVDTAHLMDKATSPYLDNIEEVTSLLTEVEKIVEYEKNKPNNEITYKMWKILSDEDKNLLNGFFKFWKEKENLSQVFITESKGQVMEAMDLLIEYEGKKDKDAMNKLMEIIGNN